MRLSDSSAGGILKVTVATMTVARNHQIYPQRSSCRKENKEGVLREGKGMHSLLFRT